MRLLLLGLAACGFTGKDVPSDATATDAPRPGDAAGDAALDAAMMIDAGPTTSCEDKWKAGGFAMGNPRKLGGNAFGRDPATNAEETAIYFNSQGLAYQAPLNGTTVGAPHQLAFWLDANKTQPVIGSVSKVSVLMGNQVAAVSIAGTNGSDHDVFLFERITMGQFDFVRDGPISVAATGADDYDPELTPDGKTLSWAPASVGQQIHIATRNDPSTQPFGNETVVATLSGGTSSNHADPTLSADRAVLLYTTSDATIRYAIYDGAKYVDKGPVPNLHATTEGDAHLSVDTCRVYFGRAGASDFDFYVSEML